MWQKEPAFSHVKTQTEAVKLSSIWSLSAGLNTTRWNHSVLYNLWKAARRRRTKTSSQKATSVGMSEPPRQRVGRLQKVSHRRVWSINFGTNNCQIQGIKQPNLGEANCESITTCGRSDSFISCTLPEATIQDMSAFSLALSFPGSKAVVKIIIIIRRTLYCRIKLRGRPAVSTVSSSNSAAQFLLLSVA